MWYLAETTSSSIPIDGKDLFWLIAGIVAVVAIVATTTSSVLIARARERTRREIAAYVAEGTIDPKDAVKMLKAGRKEECDDE